jgi:chromosome segregation ATPase
MTNEELVKRLRDKHCCESPNCNCDEAADRIEALAEGWAEATRLIELARQQYGAEKSRAETLTEQLEAARADAKEAEAYAEELEKQLNICRMAQVVMENGIAEAEKQCEGLMQAGMNNGQALILAEAKLAKAVEALLLARVHVANNEQGWSVGRASARSDLEIINATLAAIEGEKT